jgi:hypothetical protein
MIIVGLLVLILVIAVTVVAVARGGDPVTFKVGSLSFDTDGTGMFLAGAASLLLLVVAFWLLTKGLARSRHRRQEMRELRDRAARNEEAARREAASGQQDRRSADAGQTQPIPATQQTRTDESGRHVESDTDDHFDSAPRER